ncbi:uncharacterized protein ColSpa_02907 [Colletotrichum spaethianum]|uniref:NACHT-NTPase and P-loop NTPases N-terminal domain-containing protein n=1 Tax=Colletotrichum spaethianum TaxID=700344 RepID=A0AA37P527_9PEZI|nr:uncharacterized protein ColSpa_02907 [Colletotrichum spaethianum]GKT42726.1 hypothetical protein ColSpa_02907 [Colletotrichum spaethianum]
MPGPQATQVLSSTRAAISSLKGIEEDHGDLNDVEELPAAFAQVAKHLPAVCKALQSARLHIQKREDDNTWAEMKKPMDGCKAKADRLEGVYGKVVPSAPAQKMERYREAVSGLGKEGRVEVLMEAILRDVKGLLTVDGGMEAATESDLRELADITAEVLAIPPSLQGDGSALGIHNYGPGPQNVVTGDGHQYNNNNTGNQFNGSTFHGVNPFSRE